MFVAGAGIVGMDGLLDVGRGTGSEDLCVEIEEGETGDAVGEEVSWMSARTSILPY